MQSRQRPAEARMRLISNVDVQAPIICRSCWQTKPHNRQRNRQPISGHGNACSMRRSASRVLGRPWNVCARAACPRKVLRSRQRTLRISSAPCGCGTSWPARCLHFCLGPLAVSKAYRSRGLGRKLISGSFVPCGERRAQSRPACRRRGLLRTLRIFPPPYAWARPSRPRR